MIYLIGGAPRIGKSITGRQFAISISARFVSTDELENPSQEASLIFNSDAKKNVLTPSERIESVKNEAKQIILKIENIIDNTINKHQDAVIEGALLFPIYVNDFIKKFREENIRVIFIGSRSVELIMEGMARNTSENNWSKDFDQEVLTQIAVFSKAFSNYIYDESKKYNLLYKERSNDFQKDIRAIIKYFC